MGWGRVGVAAGRGQRGAPAPRWRRALPRGARPLAVAAGGRAPCGASQGAALGRQCGLGRSASVCRVRGALTRARCGRPLPGRPQSRRQCAPWRALAPPGGHRPLAAPRACRAPRPPPTTRRRPPSRPRAPPWRGRPPATPPSRGPSCGRRSSTNGDAPTKRGSSTARGASSSTSCGVSWSVGGGRGWGAGWGWSWRGFGDRTRERETARSHHAPPFLLPSLGRSKLLSTWMNRRTTPSWTRSRP